MADTHTIVTISKPLTPLIGRERELTLIEELMSSGTRLLTITGIGGIGKSRLALQSALELEPSFTGGALVVPLAEIRQASAMPAEVLKRLGTTNPTAGVHELASAFGNDRTLLVLDNLEQIPDAGDLILDVLGIAPHLTILTTSQIPLGVPGEHVLPLDPMQTPPPEATWTTETLKANSAVALFLQRARAANPHHTFRSDDFRIVYEICSLLDGIPLAIELAAARIAILSPNELRGQLSSRLDVLTGGHRSAPARQRTMRDAIAWTYSLLDTDEKRVFRYLGVYAGMISTEAIEHTLKTLELTTEPLDMIGFLVARNLIRRTPGTNDFPRYHMLQTLREFALEQLDTDGDAHTARLAHTHYIVDLAETAEPHLTGNAQAQWFGRLEADLDNIAVANEWARANRPELALRIVAALWRFLEYQGLAHRYIDLSPGATQVPVGRELLTRFWIGVGYLQEGLRMLPEAEASFTKALHLAEGSSREDASSALCGLGLVAMDSADMSSANDLLTQAVDLAKQAGNQRLAATALSNLGICAFHSGDAARAKEIMVDALHILDASVDAAKHGMLLGNIGGICNMMGDYQEGKQYLERAVFLDRELGNHVNLGHTLANLASCEMVLNEIDKADAHYREALDTARKVHLPILEAEVLLISSSLRVQQGNKLAAHIQLHQALELAQHDGAIRVMLNAANTVARDAENVGLRAEAASLLGAVDTWRANSTYPAGSDLSSWNETFREAISTGTDRQLKVMYDSATSWSLEELRRCALDVNQKQLAAIDGANPSPAESEPIRIRATLSPRELEVLQLMAQGYTNAEIADAMFISLRTITTHVSNIFGKLDAKNRAAAVAIGINEGLVNQPSATI